jgi:hypothetical protein
MKNKNKAKFKALVIVGIFWILMGASSPVRAQESTRLFQDDKDDVYTMPINDFARAVNETEATTYSEILELVTELESHENTTGPSTTPDCIDITGVTLEIGDPNATLTITMEGELDSCYYTSVVAWSNCSSDGNPMSFFMNDLNHMEVNETNYYMEYGGEQVAIQGNNAGNDVEFEFDADLLSMTANCCLYVIALSIDDETEEISWDHADDCEPECVTCENRDSDDSDGSNDGDGTLDFSDDDSTLDVWLSVWWWFWNILNIVFTGITNFFINIFGAIPETAIPFLIALFCYALLDFLSFLASQQEEGIKRAAMKTTLGVTSVITVLFAIWRLGIINRLDMTFSIETASEIFASVMYITFAIVIAYSFMNEQGSKVKSALYVLLWVIFLSITFVVAPVFDGFDLSFDTLTQVISVAFLCGMPKVLNQYGKERKSEEENEND